MRMNRKLFSGVEFLWVRQLLENHYSVGVEIAAFMKGDTPLQMLGISQITHLRSA